MRIKRQLLLGDCLARLSDVPDGSVDMVLDDPTYDITTCKWDSVIPLEPMWEQLKRITKPNSAIVLMASQPFTSALVMSNAKMFKYCWVWDKGVSGSFANAKYNPLKTHEDVCVFSFGKCMYNPQMTKRDKPARIGGVRSKSTQGGRAVNYNASLLDDKKTYTHAFPKTVQYFSPRAGNNRGLHPTQKPVTLMEYLIRTNTNKADTELDFCMGSGTTGVAAKRLRRSFIGIELDKKYFRIAKQRIKDD